MNIVESCEFCGTDRAVANLNCESCGSSTFATKGQSQKDRAASDGFVNAISLVLQDAQKSRLLLTGTALLFAVLFGVFWQKSQSVPTSPVMPAQTNSYSEHALTLASVPAATGVFEKKAIFASAMMDISSLNILIHEHYASTGELPASLLELKLEEESMTSRHVEGLKVEKAGVISVQLTQSIGENKHVKLVPELIMDGQSLQWDCFSNLAANVLVGTYCKSI